jgi:ATP-dependent helicase/nuclease subunit A
VGRAIRACPSDCVQREMPFTARFTPAELAAAGLPGLGGASFDEFLVVQGVADLAVIQRGEIWLLDFKTDHFAPAELEAKRTHHGAQLRLYAAALARIYRRPVTKRWLHFLALGITSEV